MCVRVCGVPVCVCSYSVRLCGLACLHVCVCVCLCECVFVCACMCVRACASVRVCLCSVVVRCVMRQVYDVFMFLAGCILRLPIWGDPADEDCFDDQFYWEVNQEGNIASEIVIKRKSVFIDLCKYNHEIIICNRTTYIYLLQITCSLLDVVLSHCVTR